MSWMTLDADLQKQVIGHLREAASKEQTEALANGFGWAANELELWISQLEDPFYEWLEAHKGELATYAGKAVAVHLDQGILATGTAEAFWNGSFRQDVSAVFDNDPSIFIT